MVSTPRGMNSPRTPAGSAQQHTKPQNGHGANTAEATQPALRERSPTRRTQTQVVLIRHGVPIAIASNGSQRQRGLSPSPSAAPTPSPSFGVVATSEQWYDSEGSDEDDRVAAQPTEEHRAFLEVTPDAKLVCSTAPAASANAIPEKPQNYHPGHILDNSDCTVGRPGAPAPSSQPAANKSGRIGRRDSITIRGTLLEDAGPPSGRTSRSSSFRVDRSNSFQRGSTSNAANGSKSATSISGRQRGASMKSMKPVTPLAPQLPGAVDDLISGVNVTLIALGQQNNEILFGRHGTVNNVIADTFAAMTKAGDSIAADMCFVETLAENFTDLLQDIAFDPDAARSGDFSTAAEKSASPTNAAADGSPNALNASVESRSSVPTPVANTPPFATISVETSPSETPVTSPRNTASDTTASSSPMGSPVKGLAHGKSDGALLAAKRRHSVSGGSGTSTPTFLDETKTPEGPRRRSSTSSIPKNLPARRRSSFGVFDNNGPMPRGNRSSSVGADSILSSASTANLFADPSLSHESMGASKQDVALQLRAHPQRGKTVEGCRIQEISSASDFAGMFAPAYRRRHENAKRHHYLSSSVLKVTFRRTVLSTNKLITTTLTVIDAPLASKPVHGDGAKLLMKSPSNFKEFLRVLHDTPVVGPTGKRISEKMEQRYQVQRRSWKRNGVLNQYIGDDIDGNASVFCVAVLPVTPVENTREAPTAVPPPQASGYKLQPSQAEKDAASGPLGENDSFVSSQSAEQHREDVGGSGASRSNSPALIPMHRRSVSTQELDGVFGKPMVSPRGATAAAATNNGLPRPHVRRSGSIGGRSETSTPMSQGANNVTPSFATIIPQRHIVDKDDARVLPLIELLSNHWTTVDPKKSHSEVKAAAAFLRAEIQRLQKAIKHYNVARRKSAAHREEISLDSTMVRTADINEEFDLEANVEVRNLKMQLETATSQYDDVKLALDSRQRTAEELKERCERQRAEYNKINAELEEKGVVQKAAEEAARLIEEATAERERASRGIESAGEAMRKASMMMKDQNAEADRMAQKMEEMRHKHLESRQITEEQKQMAAAGMFRRIIAEHRFGKEQRAEEQGIAKQKRILAVLQARESQIERKTEECEKDFKAYGKAERYIDSRMTHMVTEDYNREDAHIQATFEYLKVSEAALKVERLNINDAATKCRDAERVRTEYAAEAKAQLDPVEAKLQEALARDETVDRELLETSEGIADLENECADEEEGHGEMENRLTELRFSLQYNTTQDDEEEIRELEEELAKLQEANDEVNEELDRLLGDLHDREAKCNELRKQYNSLCKSAACRIVPR